MAKVNLDTAAELNIEGIYANAGWPSIELEHFEDAEGKIPKTLTGNFKMKFFNTPELKDEDLIFEMDDGTGNGLTVDINKLTIQKPSSVIVAAGKLFHIILNKVGSTEPFVIYKGTVIINPGKPWL